MNRPFTYRLHIHTFDLPGHIKGTAFICKLYNNRAECTIYYRGIYCSVVERVSEQTCDIDESH